MELQHDDEADGHEDESEVDQDHEAADALGVGTERVGCRHGLHHDTSLGRVLSSASTAGCVAAAAFGAAKRELVVQITNHDLNFM